MVIQRFIYSNKLNLPSSCKAGFVVLQDMKKKNIIKAIGPLYLSKTVLNFIVKLAFCLLRPLFVSGTSQPSSWFLIPREHIYRNILLNLSWDADDLCLGLNLAQIPSYRATGKKAGQCSLTVPQHCGESSSPSLQDISLPEAR